MLALYACAAGLAGLYALATPLVAYRVLLRSLERFAPLPPRDLGAFRCQAIVVLAGDGRQPSPEFGSPGVPGPLSLERLRYAAFVARRTALPILLVGGASSPPPTISRRMAASLADDFGVAPGWIADGSRDTLGNGQEAAATLLPLGISRVFVVTHAWHLARAVVAFRSAGLDPVPAPTAFAGAHGPWRFSKGAVVPRAGALLLSALALHEIMGLAAHRLSLRTSAAAGQRVAAGRRRS